MRLRTNVKRFLNINKSLIFHIVEVYDRNCGGRSSDWRVGNEV